MLRVKKKIATGSSMPIWECPSRIGSMEKIIPDATPVKSEIKRAPKRKTITAARDVSITERSLL